MESFPSCENILQYFIEFYLETKKVPICEIKSSMFTKQNVSGKEILKFTNFANFDFNLYAFQIAMDNRMAIDLP